MAIPTIEQFIEQGLVNCRASAALTVKKRYLDSVSGTTQDKDELQKKAAEYIASPEGAAAVQKALESGRFFRLLSSADPANDPRVIKAYRKHTAGMKQPSAEDIAEKKRSRNRRRKTGKKQRAADRREKYYEKYLAYEFTEEDEKRTFDIVCGLIERHYSDIRAVLPSKFMKEVRSEFVNEDTLLRFTRRVYDEASLNRRRIDNVIYMSGLPCATLDDVFRCTAVFNILEDSDYGPSTKESFARDFVARGRAGYPGVNEVYKRLSAAFDRERLTSLITNGEGYKDALEYMNSQIKMSESAHKLILKEIPTDVTMLYPGARSIHRHFILHLGPTNSGKTYQSLEACRKAETGVYLAPLRLLAYEICEKFNIDGVPCRMITGEEEIDIPFATHTSSTVEMLNTNEHYDVAVVDECQLIEDEERGGAWTAAVLGLMADEIHL
ncbi:MAG: hypothetical protein J6X60_04630 [Ruminiclostridium sp.]|nr:hypothetical protein [Ruminiclostridium sp.]